jgi:hypothetical protein
MLIGTFSSLMTASPLAVVVGLGVKLQLESESR